MGGACVDDLNAFRCLSMYACIVCALIQLLDSTHRIMLYAFVLSFCLIRLAHLSDGRIFHCCVHCIIIVVHCFLNVFAFRFRIFR